MFGTVKPHSCSLDDPAKKQFATFYCGLCQSLGENYGQVSRGLHSYDSVFLALLADSLLDEPAAPSSCRCPLLPVVHRPTVTPASPAMRFAAGVQMLLADQWLADRAADGKRRFSHARRLLAGNVTTARALLDDIGVDLGALDGFENEQKAIEVAGDTGPAQAAAPTARALGLVFEQIVHLPGASFRLRSGASRRALASLGEAVGRVIYLTDALDDVRKDFLRGEFNPCLERQGARLVISQPRVEQAASLLQRSLEQIREALLELPLLRHHDLLGNILGDELGRGARKATQKARAWATPAGFCQVSAWKEASAWARMGQAAMWLLAFVWSWLSYLPQALAQVGPGGKVPIKPGPSATAPLPIPVRDAGAPRAADAGLPFLKLDAGSSPPSKPEHGTSGCDPCKPCCDCCCDRGLDCGGKGCDLFGKDCCGGCLKGLNCNCGNCGNGCGNGCHGCGNGCKCGGGKCADAPPDCSGCDAM